MVRQAHTGRLSALRVLNSKPVLHGAFVWARGRVTAKNSGSRPGQSRKLNELHLTVCRCPICP
jgi:hypothetical protein